jgi:hypothetical protein
MNPWPEHPVTHGNSTCLTAGIEPEIQRGLPYVYWIAIISLVLGIMGGTKLAEKGIETKTQGRR